MWNPRSTAAGENDDNDSWEIKAFEEDTSNDATWPPRFYTCTFCRREFRSAQALGGHMNVHRRERARLEMNIPKMPSTTNINNSSHLIFPTHQALCFLYSLPNPNNHGGTTTAAMKSFMNSSSSTFNSKSVMNFSSTFTSISPLLSNNSPATTPQYCIGSSIEPSVSNGDNNWYNGARERDAAIKEEIDLELRLGSSSSSSP